ncbi:hypothetical protein [Aeromonas finlandensis]|uniref:hypothetical protein n=1 Tax=Aeromonas finlandensis TaxID=1543375 RepID=UPI000B1933AD|nr:hypothetical protein [Aeromonas finlandensis]
MQGNMFGYKLDTLHAVDSFANQVVVIDETIEIMSSKQDDYIAGCTQLRTAQP